ncbi:AAA family ATPase [Rhizobium sp. BR 249]|uniref:AAA family ATPase n=1 Tax=Rhizobium sp. BR 249 TaxID=3040011 RepID=UPI0039BF35FC
MLISQIEVANFRKLEAVRIDLSQKRTVFVGANNSGKTSAMTALRRFLVEPREFVVTDFTLSNWIKLNAIGKAWETEQAATALQGNPIGASQNTSAQATVDIAASPQSVITEEVPLNGSVAEIDSLQAVSQPPQQEPTPDFFALLPQIDIWLDVKDGEMHYVKPLIPTLDWEKGLLGVRLRFEPSDFNLLQNEYCAIRAQNATTLKEAVQAGGNQLDLSLWPSNLMDFLERRLQRFFRLKAYLLDPSMLVVPIDGLAYPQVLPTSAVPLESNPLEGLIKVNEINAQRGLGQQIAARMSGDGVGDAVEYRGGRRLSGQLRSYFDKHLDPTESPDVRIVTLLNKIREATDSQKQIPCSKAEEGFVRLFLLHPDTHDKPAAEQRIAGLMADESGDALWRNPEEIKNLILEHKMAARRLGFFELYEPLYSFEPFRTGLRDGTLPLLNFFASRIVPLVDARADKFAVMRIVSKFSPLMTPETLRAITDERAHLKKVQKAVDSLVNLVAEDASPTFLDMLNSVDQSHLFAIPDILRPALAGAAVSESDDDLEEDKRSERDIAISTFLNAPFKQIRPYLKYSSGLAQFDTHQGVKGLEFPRVMVIMDDTEAAGFAFKYDKLFTPDTAEDGVAAATRRLFYVTCSRAEQSLCLVAYSKNPDAIRETLLNRGWFEEREICILDAPAS